MSNQDALSERIDALSPERRLLLEQMRKEKRASATQGEVIPRRQSAGDSPLSFAQESLWFLHQLEPGRHDYNIPAALRLKGRLNVAALEQCLNEIARRHEILRTTFREVEGAPVQVVTPGQGVPLVLEDLSAVPEEERESHAMRRSAEEAQRPFDLARGPLMRATLLRLGEEDHFLLFTAHHIVCDAWSVGIITREVAELYQAFSTGKNSELPELPLQYADFAEWQRRWLQGETLENLSGYWLRQLGGQRPSLELPTDRPRPTSATSPSRVQYFVIPKPLVESLARLSQSEGTTLFMTLLAAFKVLLHRYTRQEDIIVGAPVAGRNKNGLDNLIGFFVNTVALRTDLSGEPTFKETLGRVRDVTLSAFDYQDLPFSKLVELLRPERGISYTPLVRATFWLQTIPVQPLELADVVLTPVEVNNGAAAYDISVVIEEGEEGYRGKLTYRADIFDASSIDEMIRNYLVILESIVADPSQRLSALPCVIETKRQQEAMQATGGAEVAAASPQPESVDESWELTSGQLLMWLGQQLHPADPVYNEIVTFDIKGNIDPARFREAFQSLLDSTDALRTTTLVKDGVPRQQFAPHSRYEMEYVDLTGEADPARSLDELISGRKVIPLQLDVRLYDSLLAKISDDHFVWYLCLHHMITDAWSFSLVYRRMAELYARRLEGGMDALPEYPQFKAYVEYERQYRKSAQFAKAEAYWQKKLAESFEPVSFYGNAGEKTTRIERVAYDLGAERTQRLKAISTQEGFAALTQEMSLFNIFTTIVFAYLYRISGNARHSLGVPFHNRNSKAFRETVGALMVVCPLRVTITDDDTFTSLVRKVQLETRETLQYSQYVTANSPEQGTYDVMLNYLNVKFGDFNGLPSVSEMTHSGHSTETLMIQAQNYSDGESTMLTFDFNAGVFSEEHRQAAVRHFLLVLDAFLAEPRQTIGRINLLSEAEKAIVSEPSKPIGASLDAPSVVQLFEAQAERTPEAVAVTFDGGQLTYRQLNERANQLAHHLQRLEVGPDVPVALCIERSQEMLVGLLGILKAGAAYVPLDPKHLSERAGLILQDTQARVLLTQSHLLAKLPPHNSHDLCLDSDWETIAQESAANPQTRIQPENLAYIIYTSGSTGNPKGVMITHGSLLNYTQIAADSFALRASDRVLQFASIAFDTAAEEIFTCLSSGATLVLQHSDALESAPIFFRWCDASGITVLDLPTAYWHGLAADIPAVDKDYFEKLRLVIIGGEKASAKALKLWREHVNSRIRLIDTYGPTETTIVATSSELTAQAHDATPTIGRPIPNVRAYILNGLLEPMPVGAAGHLYIGGSGLARGYLDNPRLTAERFIPDPFGVEAGARLYKTGDMARYRPDGSIEFAGRADRQVKMRGFRIEPGEIEAALTEHPAIREAAVVGNAGGGGGGGASTLVAFCVVEEGQTPGVNDVRQFLQRKLPEYMVPAQLVYMDALPLTSQGKVDYRALRMPAQDQASARQDIVAPRTPEEKIIADIWSSLLEMDVNEIGVMDNFFELGGHSLLGTQLMSRINNVFQTEIPLRYLFETPTIDGLALAIARVKAEQLDAERAQQILADLDGLTEEELDWILANEIPFDEEPS